VTPRTTPRLRAVALLAAAAAALAVLTPATASAGSAAVDPAGDTFVTSLYPNNNYSASATMRANSSPEKITLLRLEVTGVPAGATDVVPTLVLHGSGNTQPAQTVTVTHVEGAWDPATVT
jgi:hypothetical protein